MADSVLSVRLEGAADVQARLEKLGSRIPGVLSRAINRTGEQARTETQREITARSNFPARRALALLRLERSSETGRRAIVKASEFRQPLIHYVGTGGFRSGLGIAGRGYRLGAVPAGGFFARVRGKTRTGKGHRGIFARLRPTEPRNKHASPGLPIDELKGDSMADVIRKFHIYEGLTPRLQQIFAERLAHEVGRVEGLRA